jgi:hypothetical protein
MESAPSVDPPDRSHPKRAPFRPLLAWAGLGVALSLLTTTWWHFSTRFYDQVLPFYDSASYQEGYRAIADLSRTQGIGSTLVAVWQEPASNVVLYRFFAAVAGPWIPAPREGLLIYLFGLHLLAGGVLALTVHTITRRILPAFAAVATWFLTTPFTLLRDGVGDQRLDLSSGSALLIVTALGLRWTHRPTPTTACLTGLAAALAALHRPILIPTIAILGLLFAGFALLQHRRSLGQWLRLAGLAVLPIAVITCPWIVRNFEELRVYYLEYGPDVGTSVSFLTAARFNWLQYQSAFGLPAAVVLFIGLALTARASRFQPARALLVVACWITPLAILILSRSAGNTYVQQAALGLPALLFVAWQPRQPADTTGNPWDVRLALLCLAIPVIVTPLRLSQSLAREPQHERQEVAHLLAQMAIPSTGASVAGFHDLPVSPVSLCMVARNEGIPLQVGILSYYPSDFGLTNDYLTDVSSPEVQQAVIAKLASIKQQDDLLILPTADTAFRLWNGLYSHRLLPTIRAQVQQDPDFQPPQRVGPVKEVYFDVYRIRRD